MDQINFLSAVPVWPAGRACAMNDFVLFKTVFKAEIFDLPEHFLINRNRIPGVIRRHGDHLVIYYNTSEPLV